MVWHTLRTRMATAKATAAAGARQSGGDSKRRQRKGPAQ
jgi:hypothetical protein